MKCFSCHAEVPDIEGEVHRYMLSSPGCWQLYGKLLEREYSNPEYRVNHRITVDAYAVQHYGHSSPQAIQSVNLHLASLFLIYEKRVPVILGDRALTALARFKSELFWLDVPDDMGIITVNDVLMASDVQQHCHKVFQWGESAWNAWKSHKEMVEAFVARHQPALFI
jgi:hypothetical protein